MPNCPRTCSKVKRDLRRLAAERKRGLEGRPGPSTEKSTELEEELNIYDYSDDEILSKSVCSKSARSHKSIESKSLCSRSARSYKNTENDFEKSEDESRDPRCGGLECNQMEDFPRTKRRGRSRNREEYESDESEDYISPSRKPCSSQCSSRKLKDEAIKRRQNAKQKDLDDNHLHEGINFFKGFCNCSTLCLVKQLWASTYFRKSLVSVALAGVGLKLCYDLDGWQIPVKI